MGKFYIEYSDANGVRQKLELNNLLPHEAQIMHGYFRKAAKSNAHILAFGCAWDCRDRRGEDAAETHAVTHKVITASMFEAATGDKPVNDDLERSNCDKAGQPGHFMCGWCEEENLPMFMVDSKYARKQEEMVKEKEGK
jgi:hypothetical protein